MNYKNEFNADKDKEKIKEDSFDTLEDVEQDLNISDISEGINIYINNERFNYLKNSGNFLKRFQ